MPSISSDMRALYEAHFELVWRYMAQRNVRQANIDDLVHKVFRVVREHPCRQQMQQKRRVFVCMIARQVLREHQRTESASMTEDADALTEIFERDAVSELLLGGLESMTDIEREAYLLCEAEGMSMEDVALAIGVPELAVQRKRARASRQMSEFLSKMRTSGIWRTSQPAAEADLLRTLHAACTPTDRDRDRVFAAMIAYSLSAQAPRAAREPAAAAAKAPDAPAARASAAGVKQAAPSAPEATPRLLALSWPPPRIDRRSTRVWFAAMVAAALLAGGVSSHFVGATHAAERPRATRTTGETKLQTGTGAAHESSKERPLAATPESAAADQPSRGEPSVAATAPAAAEPGVAVRDQPSRPAKSAVDPGTDNSKRARVAEAKLLFAAERAYLDGNTSRALALITKHRHAYPSTAYTVERRVLQGQILCTKGRYREAQRLILELEATDANPASLAAVYRVCSGHSVR